MNAIQNLKLVRDRIEFELSNTSKYIDFVVTKLEEARVKELEDQQARDRRLGEFYGDDLRTDADIENELMRRGGSPDDPETPFSPLDAAFPRAVTYSCTIIVCLVFEGETQVLCSALADWKGVPPIRGTSRFRDKTYAFLDQHVGRDILDAKLKEDIAVLFSGRNCIVHTDGRIDLVSPKERRDDLAAFTKARPDFLSIREYLRPEEMMLEVDPKYCTHALKVITNFFARVFNAMSEKQGMKWNEW